MSLKEKMIRKINAHVQKSGMSADTKLLAQNTVLAMDICKKLSALTSDKSASYAQRKNLNDKLRYIAEYLR